MYNIPPTIRQDTRASRTWLEVRDDDFLAKYMRDEITWDSHIGRVYKTKKNNNYLCLCYDHESDNGKVNISIVLRQTPLSLTLH